MLNLIGYGAHAQRGGAVRPYWEKRNENNQNVQSLPVSPAATSKVRQESTFRTCPRSLCRISLDSRRLHRERELLPAAASSLAYRAHGVKQREYSLILVVREREFACSCSTTRLLRGLYKFRRLFLKVLARYTTGFRLKTPARNREKKIPGYYLKTRSAKLRSAFGQR